MGPGARAIAERTSGQAAHYVKGKHGVWLLATGKDALRQHLLGANLAVRQVLLGRLEQKQLVVLPSLSPWALSTSAVAMRSAVCSSTPSQVGWAPREA